jgi:hypothetical protein
MPTLMGNYKVPHFDAKDGANHVFTELGLPTTFTSFYWENFIYFRMGPKKGPAAEDIGKCAYGILRRGHEYIGKTIGIAGEHLTGAEMAAAFTRSGGSPQRCVTRRLSQPRFPWS